MSRKRTLYSAEFKTKLVLEILKNDKTINEIANTNNITPKNLQNWKKTFLENAEIAMEPARAVKEYKKEIKELEAKNDEYAKMVGKLTVERDWLSKKVRSLDSSNNEHLVISKLPNLSITRQCQLIGLSRSNLYYKARKNPKKELLLKAINTVYSEIPIYGAAKVRQQLLDSGHKVSLNTVSKYRQELGLKPILAVRSAHTSIPNKEHKKYTYKLRNLEITRANQVWCTDITYIKIKHGFVYLAAIIDWYSKAVLTSAISNTMDADLVTNVLEKAMAQYGKPDIFNTDQGSVYTSSKHTKLLTDKGIVISMDGKGRATDNIAIERFWRSAKCERIYLNEYHTVKDLKEDVQDYIYFYNHKRYHQTLKYKKPMEVYHNSLLTADNKSITNSVESSIQ
jgi:putative transposase